MTVAEKTGESIHSTAKDEWPFRNGAEESVEPEPNYQNSSDRKSTPNDFGEPIPLEIPVLPALPDGIFTGVVGDMIYAVAASTETPPELAATYALANLGMACQGRFSVHAEGDHFEHLAFWAACAMPPGSRKTPVMMSMMKWANDWQKAARKKFEPIIKKAETDHHLLSSRVKALRDRAIKSPQNYAELAKEADELEKQIQPVPYAPRLMVEDVTTEHLGTMLKRHNERLGIFSDETGSLDNWGGKYNNGVANIDLVLKAHSGSSYAVDRGSRESVLLDHPLLSIGIAPQPAVIAGMVNNATFRGRGLPARFVIFLPDSRLGFRTLRTIPIPDEVKAAYAERMIELSEMKGHPDGDGGFHPHVLNLSGNAWKLWKEFSREVEGMMRPEGPLEKMTDFGGKLPGAVARIAGLLYLADHGNAAQDGREIDDATMLRAVNLARFTIPHEKAVLEGMDEKGEAKTAKRVWSGITSEKRFAACAKERKDPMVITAREAWLPMRATIKRPAGIEPYLRLLVEHEYMREIPGETKPGRPSRRFVLNKAAIAA